MTCEPSQPQGSLPMELPSMSSAAGFRARTFQSPANELGLRANARAYGRNMSASLARFDPVTFSWRMSQGCLVAQANGQADGSVEFSETWPRSGVMRNGIAYPLDALALRTSATECGLWPTPTVVMSGENRTIEQFEAAKERALIKQKGNNGNGIGEDLAIAVKRRMWPTPIRRDGRTFAGAARSPNAVGSEPLVIQVGGKLNPAWVAWLMGFPATWTDGVSVPSKPSATP